MAKAPKPKSEPICRDEHHSVSVRKIENGYVVARSHSGPKGYRSSETFHAQKPKLEIPTPKAGKRK